MLSMYRFEQVRQLADAGMSRTAIAKQLGVDRKTVAKYLSSNAPPRYKPRDRPTRVDPFAPFEATARAAIEAVREISGEELHELLSAAGYRGSLRTVERRLTSLKGGIAPKERYFEQEYRPGEQCQLDFKESFEVPFVDGTRLIHLLFGTLPYSGAVHATGYPFKTYEAFAAGMHAFFEVVGGVPENARFDNLSPCVAKIRSGSQRIYTDAFTRAIRYYGFGTLPCRPAKGSDKGDVERDIRTYARRIRTAIKLSGRVFTDLADFNAWLADFLVRRRTERTRALLGEEVAHLKPLPPRDDAVLCKINDTTATSYGTVRVGRSSYSVPDHVIDRPCRVILSGSEVVVRRIGDGGEICARHPRLEDGDHSINLEHVLPSLVRKPQAMVRWAHRHILFPLPGFSAFYEYLKTLPHLVAEREFLRSVNLVLHAAVADVGAGMDVVREAGSTDPYMDLRALVVGNDAVAAAAQPAIDPALHRYDTLIPEYQEVIG